MRIARVPAVTKSDANLTAGNWHGEKPVRTTTRESARPPDTTIGRSNAHY